MTNDFQSEIEELEKEYDHLQRASEQRASNGWVEARDRIGNELIRLKRLELEELSGVESATEKVELRTEIEELQSVVSEE